MSFPSPNHTHLLPGKKVAAGHVPKYQHALLQLVAVAEEADDVAVSEAARFDVNLGPGKLPRRAAALLLLHAHHWLGRRHPRALPRPSLHAS